MKLLLVDDDLLLVHTIRHSLSPTFRVESVHTGEDGIFYATNTRYDVVLLDISLPDIQGIEVCQQIRRNQCDIPILFLSATQDITAKVTAFLNGADDYLTKPFYKEELLSRIKALVRRYDRRKQIEQLVIDDIQIDLERRTISRQEATFTLRHKDFDILSLLVRNRGKIVKRHELQAYVWGDDTELSASTIDVHINYLRVNIEKKIGRQLIRTIHGLGFMIE